MAAYSWSYAYKFIKSYCTFQGIVSIIFSVFFFIIVIKLHTERKLIYDALNCCLKLFKFKTTHIIQEDLILRCPTTRPVSDTSVQSVHF